MRPLKIKPVQNLKGVVRVPGDKSVSHRALMLSAISKGRTVINNFLFSDDCLVTLRALSACGIKISADKRSAKVRVFSSGVLISPKKPLFMNESGTSTRVLAGLFAGQKVTAVLTGARSLNKRPMERIIKPLELMGASIKCGVKEGFLPFEIFPAELHGITWKQKIASAQVKSAILLAGITAEGESVVIEPHATRDHTERMLKLFGARIKVAGNMVRLCKSELFSPGKISIPGDISSAAFFIVAGLIVPGSKLIIKDVGINPTRAGLLNVLRRMGAKINLLKKKNTFEPIADIEVVSSRLKGVIVESSEIPSLIDELPILMVAASFAGGKTLIKGVGELRVKEADRVESMRYNLTKLGVNIQVKRHNNNENVEIHGSGVDGGVHLKSFSDHRTAMSMVVAALSSRKGATLDDISCVKKSFPAFMPVLNHLIGKQQVSRQI